MNETRNTYKITVGRSEENHLGDLGIDERILLKWVLEKWGWMVWVTFIWLRIGPGSRLL
jgi:hypothetical protein